MAPSEALTINGSAITDDTKKAGAFTKHYAAVSRLKFSREERLRNRLSKRTNAEGPDIFLGSSLITMTELKTAIKAMYTNGAPDPDELSTKLLESS